MVDTKDCFCSSVCFLIFTGKILCDVLCVIKKDVVHFNPSKFGSRDDNPLK
jgi:hypothetical protein